MPTCYFSRLTFSTKRGRRLGSTEFQTALRSAKKAVSLQPGLGAAHDLLAKLYLQAGQNREAIEESRKALSIDPKDQTAVYHLIQALRKTGDKTELPDSAQTPCPASPGSDQTGRTAQPLQAGRGERAAKPVRPTLILSGLDTCILFPISRNPRIVLQPSVNLYSFASTW